MSKTQIIEHIPDYKVPVMHIGLGIPDVVEMTKWRDGSDIITTYRDGNKYWHFRQSFMKDEARIWEDVARCNGSHE